MLLADASSQTETVIHDLQECFQTLFPEIKSNDKLITNLQRISNDIVAERRKNPTEDGLINVDRKYAKELADFIANNLPALLQKQSWFDEVFPSKWASN